jgi:hypothetical protein
MANDPIDSDVEMKALRQIVDGFNKQAVAIPTIAMRFLNLEGDFTKEQVEEAVALYKDVVETKLSGHNITVCQVAAFHILADLVLQAMDARQKQEVKKPAVERNPAYA